MFKPDQRVEIDHSHPLAKHLAFAVVPIRGELYPRDLVTGIVPIDAGSSSLRVRDIDRKGRTLGTDAAQQGLFYGRTLLDDITDVEGISIYARARKSINSQIRFLFSSAEGLTVGDGVGLRFDDNTVALNSLLMYANNDNTATSAVQNSLGLNSEDRYHDIGFTHKVAATVGQFYVSGVPVISSTTMSISTNSGRKTRLFAGRQGTGEADISLVYLYVFKTRLPDSVAADIFVNPWQLLKTKRLDVGFVIPAGVTGNPWYYYAQL